MARRCIQILEQSKITQNKTIMTISNLLRFSPEQYESLIFEYWFAYAEFNSFDEQDLQKILANGAYFKWFLQEYRTLEAEFLAEIKPYKGKLDETTLRDFYHEKVFGISKNYSKYLLKNARKTKIINQNHN